MVLSAVASLVALGLRAVGDVSTVDLVAVVAVVGFTTSWVQTGRVRRTVAARPTHRVTVMPRAPADRLTAAPLWHDRGP